MAQPTVRIHPPKRGDEDWLASMIAPLLDMSSDLLAQGFSMGPISVGEGLDPQEASDLIDVLNGFGAKAEHISGAPRSAAATAPRIAPVPAAAPLSNQTQPFDGGHLRRMLAAAAPQAAPPRARPAGRPVEREAPPAAPAPRPPTRAPRTPTESPRPPTRAPQAPVRASRADTAPLRSARAPTQRPPKPSLQHTPIASRQPTAPRVQPALRVERLDATPPQSGVRDGLSGPTPALSGLSAGATGPAPAEPAPELVSRPYRNTGRPSGEIPPWFPQVPMRPGARDGTQKKSSRGWIWIAVVMALAGAAAWYLQTRG